MSTKTTWGHDWEQHPTHSNVIFWRHDLTPQSDITYVNAGRKAHHEIKFTFTHERAGEVRTHLIPPNRLGDYQNMFKRGILAVGKPVRVRTCQLKSQRGRKNRWWEPLVLDMRPQYEDFDETVLTKLVRENKLRQAQSVYNGLLQANCTAGQKRYIAAYEQRKPLIEELLNEEALILF